MVRVTAWTSAPEASVNLQLSVAGPAGPAVKVKADVEAGDVTAPGLTDQARVQPGGRHDGCRAAGLVLREIGRGSDGWRGWSRCRGRGRAPRNGCRGRGRCRRRCRDRGRCGRRCRGRGRGWGRGRGRARGRRRGGDRGRVHGLNWRGRFVRFWPPPPPPHAQTMARSRDNPIRKAARGVTLETGNGSGIGAPSVHIIYVLII